MLDEPKKRRMESAVWTAAALLVIGLAAGYLGTYARTVRQEGMVYLNSPARNYVSAVYSDDEDWDRTLRCFFAPANQVDRRLRPAKWGDL